LVPSAPLKCFSLMGERILAHYPFPSRRLRVLSKRAIRGQDSTVLDRRIRKTVDRWIRMVYGTHIVDHVLPFSRRSLDTDCITVCKSRQQCFQHKHILFPQESGKDRNLRHHQPEGKPQRKQATSITHPTVLYHVIHCASRSISTRPYTESSWGKERALTLVC
jgi:hypothetical protein